ncbi:unnamed protein product [Pleuronectes platessa]|uniref:Uncharacterized protein n=1 Tax=Pleuronectes platessa TaxID=8262 RepID=A0A9N7Z7G8_PLEPL|nr:unnamed protein product [Pleuronectes platessa]
MPRRTTVNQQQLMWNTDRWHRYRQLPITVTLLVRHDNEMNGGVDGVYAVLLLSPPFSCLISPSTLSPGYRSSSSVVKTTAHSGSLSVCPFVFVISSAVISPRARRRIDLTHRSISREVTDPHPIVKRPDEVANLVPLDLARLTSGGSVPSDQTPL